MSKSATAPASSSNLQRFSDFLRRAELAIGAISFSGGTALAALTDYLAGIVNTANVYVYGSPTQAIPVGASVTQGNVTVAITQLGSPDSNGTSTAYLNIYCNENGNQVLISTTGLDPGQTIYDNPTSGAPECNGQHWSVTVNQTFNGLYAYQKWVKLDINGIQQTYTPSTLVQSTGPAYPVIANDPLAFKALGILLAAIGLAMIVHRAAGTAIENNKVAKLEDGLSPSQSLGRDPRKRREYLRSRTPKHRHRLINAIGSQAINPDTRADALKELRMLSRAGHEEYRGIALEKLEELAYSDNEKIARDAIDSIQKVLKNTSDREAPFSALIDIWNHGAKHSGYAGEKIEELLYDTDPSARKLVHDAVIEMAEDGKHIDKAMRLLDVCFGSYKRMVDAINEGVETIEKLLVSDNEKVREATAEFAAKLIAKEDKELAIPARDAIMRFFAKPNAHPEVFAMIKEKAPDVFEKRNK